MENSNQEVYTSQVSGELQMMMDLWLVFYCGKPGTVSRRSTLQMVPGELFSLVLDGLVGLSKFSNRPNKARIFIMLN